MPSAPSPGKVCERSVGTRFGEHVCLRRSNVFVSSSLCMRSVQERNTGTCRPPLRVRRFRLRIAPGVPCRRRAATLTTRASYGQKGSRSIICRCTLAAKELAALAWSSSGTGEKLAWGRTGARAALSSFATAPHVWDTRPLHRAPTDRRRRWCWCFGWAQVRHCVGLVSSRPQAI
jgi:hypothetical protein